MIQLRLLREFPINNGEKMQKFDKPFIPAIQASDIQTLFKTAPELLSQIPEKERWNIFYTSHPCFTDKRIWNATQEILPFDIDGIDTSEEKLPIYIDVVCKALELDPNSLTIIFTGNGLHFIILLDRPIAAKEYFDTDRIFYKAACALINKALTDANLLGKADPAVFSAARLLRFPGTENRKAGKPSRQARFLVNKLTKIPFDLRKLVKLPEVDNGSQIDRSQYSMPLDKEGVLSLCGFLRHCKEGAAKLPEPEWFAMLSIVARLPGGREIAHAYSKNYKGYSFEETDLKIDQAIASSGPRTCSNISSMGDWCIKCPYNGKITSPITIQSPEFIPTKESGFHLRVEKSGRVSWIPQYQDLLKFFDKEYKFVGLAGSNMIYVWKKNHYVEMSDEEIKAFAARHFKPFCNNTMASEFLGAVQRANLMPAEWFNESIKGKINFRNGILLEDDSLIPHAPVYGFRDILPYEYDKAAKCPNFIRFLDDITCGDESLKNLFLEYTGYALSNDPIWIHKAWVMLGSGENGKSTAMDIIRELAGKENYTTINLPDFSKEGHRQLLDGKFFNMSEETPTKSLADSSHFKNLSAGGEIVVRQLYKKAYIMRNKAKLIFACNELPGATDASHGFFRRFLIMPFKAVFSSDEALIKSGHAKAKDPFIKDRLMAELPGIFNLVREHYQTVKRQGGFSKSMSSENELNQFKNDVDYTGAWIANNLEDAGDEKFVSFPDVYASYSQEMEALNLLPLNGTIFGKRHKYATSTKKINGKATRVLLKCQIKSDSTVGNEKF